MRLLILLFSISLILLSSSCRKNKNPEEELKLPPITQNGANTFGCKVNGEVWLPKGSLLKSGILGDYSNGTLLLTAQNSPDPLTVIRFEFYNVISGVGDYTIAHNIELTHADTSRSVSYSKAVEFFASETGSGTFTLTKLDTVNYIYSGTFAFDAWDKDSNKVSITEGRFDHKYAN